MKKLKEIFKNLNLAPRIEWRQMYRRTGEKGGGEVNVRTEKEIKVKRDCWIAVVVRGHAPDVHPQELPQLLPRRAQ